ncbi:MAG: glycosyltransferase family 2 protein [Phocaeicola sp.]
MKQPKVSVIIPVYNTAPYLCNAVESILKQSLKEIEIIIVNDGSTDESGEIVRKYAATDNRIKLIEQANKGLSEARNAGMPYVTGEFLYYMDSDDQLESQCLQSCYDYCKAEGLDFVCFDAEALQSEMAPYMQDYNRSHLIKSEQVYKGGDLFQRLVKNGGFRASVWLIFSRVSMVNSCFSGFYPGVLHEDHLYSVPLFLFSKRVGYIAHAFFKRRVRSDSIMGKRFTNRNIEGYKVVIQGLFKLTHTYPEYATSVKLYLQQMLNAVVWQAHELPFKDKIDFASWLIKSRLVKNITLRNMAVLWLKK